MLKGLSGEILPGHYCIIPKLSDFVDITQQSGIKILNAFAAKRPILSAVLINKEKVVEDILEERKEIDKKLKGNKNEANVQSLSENFHQKFFSEFPAELQNSIEFDVYKFKDA